MFCAIVTSIDRLKTEAIVDIFQVVKSQRIQKPGLVPTVVSAVSVCAHASHVFGDNVWTCYRNSPLFHHENVFSAIQKFVAQILFSIERISQSDI